jgi:hypothetical protein
MKFIAVIFFSIFFQTEIFAQCCSPGNPVGGTSNIGILDKKTVRLITFYRSSFSQGYWQGDKKSDYNFVKSGQFNYAGITLGYGLLNKITIETELGYFINKTQHYNTQPTITATGFGLNNAVFTVKYNLIKKTEKPFEWTIGVGGKFPFTRKFQMADNVELPRDVQPSTNAFGIVAQSFLYKGFPEKKLRLFFINRYEMNFPDIKNYKYGNTLFNSFFISKQIGQSNWTAIAQVRYEYRAKDITNANCNSCFTNGTTVGSSGGNLVFIAPQINYTIAKKWNISLLADVPVYHNYNGTQLGNKFALALYVSRDFGGKCEVK